MKKLLLLMALLGSVMSAWGLTFRAGEGEFSITLPDGTDLPVVDEENPIHLAIGTTITVKSLYGNTLCLLLNVNDENADDNYEQFYDDYFSDETQFQITRSCSVGIYDEDETEEYYLTYIVADENGGGDNPVDPIENVIPDGDVYRLITSPDKIVPGKQYTIAAHYTDGNWYAMSVHTSPSSIGSVIVGEAAEGFICDTPDVLRYHIVQDTEEVYDEDEDETVEVPVYEWWFDNYAGQSGYHGMSFKTKSTDIQVSGDPQGTHITFNEDGTADISGETGRKILWAHEKNSDDNGNKINVFKHSSTSGKDYAATSIFRHVETYEFPYAGKMLKMQIDDEDGILLDLGSNVPMDLTLKETDNNNNQYLNILSIEGNTITPIHTGLATVTATWSEQEFLHSGEVTFQVRVADGLVLQDAFQEVYVASHAGCDYEFAINDGITLDSSELDITLLGSKYFATHETEAGLDNSLEIDGNTISFHVTESGMVKFGVETYNTDYDADHRTAEFTILILPYINFDVNEEVCIVHDHKDPDSGFQGKEPCGHYLSKDSHWAFFVFSDGHISSTKFVPKGVNVAFNYAPAKHPDNLSETIPYLDDNEGIEFADGSCDVVMNYWVYYDEYPEYCSEPKSQTLLVTPKQPTIEGTVITASGDAHLHYSIGILDTVTDRVTDLLQPATAAMRAESTALTVNVAEEGTLDVTQYKDILLDDSHKIYVRATSVKPLGATEKYEAHTVTSEPMSVYVTKDGDIISAIRTVGDDTTVTPAELYDLRGIRVTSSPAPGLYLRRTGTTVRKVVIR